jgi:hypothetical protein
MIAIGGIGCIDSSTFTFTDYKQKTQVTFLLADILCVLPLHIFGITLGVKIRMRDGEMRKFVVEKEQVAYLVMLGKNEP